MRCRRAVHVLVLAVLAAGAARADDAARGAALLAPFKSQLQQALQDGLRRGPAAAIGACRIEAPALAAALSRDGVRLGRTSHRLRNPANAGPAWASAVLDDYLDAPDARAGRVVAIAPGRLGWIEPIVTQPQCVACHGEAIAPAVAAALVELYPTDRAVGFKPGELRGVFWVEFPAAP